MFLPTALWKAERQFSTPTGLVCSVVPLSRAGTGELLTRLAVSQHFSPRTDAGLGRDPGRGCGGGTFLSQTGDQTSPGAGQAGVGGCGGEGGAGLRIIHIHVQVDMNLQELVSQFQNVLLKS